MKKTILMLTVVTALFFTACNQKTNPEAVLENEQQRLEIMTAIVEDHELMTEMHQAMMNSEHGKMMMTKNEDMMRMMMGNQKMMMNMMQENPEMRKQMMQNMMNMMAGHKGMMTSMMDMMHQKGMMSDQCYKSCMDNMGKMMEEGMMGGQSEEMGMDDNSHDQNH